MGLGNESEYKILVYVTWPRWPIFPYMVKTFFSGTERLMTLQLFYTASVLKHNEMMTLGWPWPCLWHGQTCFLMHLHMWKLIQHIVCMYFPACSKLAYPLRSGEWYRTIGPLVYSLSTRSRCWIKVFHPLLKKKTKAAGLCRDCTKTNLNDFKLHISVNFKLNK